MVYVGVSWHLYIELVLGDAVESLVGEWNGHIGIFQ